MGVKDDLIDRFRPAGRSAPGGELYLPRSKALQLLRACEDGGVAMIGVEAFMLESSSIRPLLDWIADCEPVKSESWEDRLLRCNRFCRDFLMKLPDLPGLMVAVVLLTKEEWSQQRKTS